MTRNKFTAMFAGIAVLSAASACDFTGLTDLNRNPNAPEAVSPALLFPAAAVSTIRQVRGSMEITPSAFVHWPQYASEYQYPEISYYQFRPTTADGWWNTFYTGPLQDLEQAMRQSVEAARPNQIGPILVLRAFNYSTMTGMWGDIPFTEASQGDLGNFTPVYTSQQVIYESLLTNLADANTMMASGTDAGFGSADPVYAGDMAKWQKFANSLRARLGMNLSNVDATRAAAEVSAAIAAGGFASNADNAQITWPGDGTNNNPWFDTELEGQGTRDDTRFSATFIDTLKSLNDPRLPIFARPTQASVTAGSPAYAGMPNGLLAGPAGGYGTIASRLGPQIFDAAQPSYFMTYAEFSFIKAEAAQRGWITGSAAQFYNEGITASMEQWGVAAADIAAYLAQPSVVYKGAAGGLAQIGVQKWIALFTQGYEAWSEWRRTGFPNLTIAQNAITTEIPRRVIYPQTEQSFNLANLQAAITSQGGSDALEKHLWIDP